MSENDKFHSFLFLCSVRKWSATIFMLCPTVRELDGASFFVENSGFCGGTPQNVLSYIFGENIIV